MDEVENRFWQGIRHFKYPDFSYDGDPASGLLMNHWLISCLDEMRETAGHAFIIHHNGGISKQGHCDGSYHYQGMAVDGHFDWSVPFREQASLILSLGRFGGIGLYPEWKPVPGFHLDVRNGFQIWVKRKGEYIYFFE